MLEGGHFVKKSRSVLGLILIALSLSIFLFLFVTNVNLEVECECTQASLLLLILKTQIFKALGKFWKLRFQQLRKVRHYQVLVCKNIMQRLIKLQILCVLFH